MEPGKLAWLSGLRCWSSSMMIWELPSLFRTSRSRLDGLFQRLGFGVTQSSKPHTQNPKPQTLNPKTYTLNPKTYTLNPKTYTLNPKTYTLNPETYTLIPKTYTPNPKPKTEARGLPILGSFFFFVLRLALFQGSVPRL